MRPANRYAEWLHRLRTLFPDTETQTYTITATPRETNNPGELTLNYTQLTVSTPAHGIFLVVITPHPHEESQPYPTAAPACATFLPDNCREAELARRKRVLWESWPVVVRDGIDVVGLVTVGAAWEGAPEVAFGYRVDYAGSLVSGEEGEEEGIGLVECIRGPVDDDGFVERFLVGLRGALPFAPGSEAVRGSDEVVEIE
ncbi:hypothetical protein ASPACDRAFT_63269 [Aspergillus aculeatus ATCC 16872]|uniref:Uncharacterized protein n=1 Tax=Aspergillus aculeatus (strain ATCC 16872 / CBS 172.66 / WB 5094) TaxID=690307 RepID=A0A1L9WLC6_ASPA1|nr:uncharacterized protein ASPACDRAFT_63269 [Aspergillus aculeatus ATCC 16872]OJJ96957.1 hypothetical protein ASPACDRAFT_63269 [Aspergillus aculeatus ATCC 16872]